MIPLRDLEIPDHSSTELNLPLSILQIPRLTEPDPTESDLTEIQ